MKLRTLESRNLIPLFHIFLFKLRKYNPANWILSRKNREIKYQEGTIILPCVCSFYRSQTTSKCGSRYVARWPLFIQQQFECRCDPPRNSKRQNRVYFSGNRLSAVNCVQGFFKCDLNQTKIITLVSYNGCSWSARTQEARENAYESAGNRYTFHPGLMEKTARIFFEPIVKCSKERQKVIKLLSKNDNEGNKKSNNAKYLRKSKSYRNSVISKA